MILGALPKNAFRSIKYFWVIYDKIQQRESQKFWRQRHREHFWESDQADNVPDFGLKLIPRPFWQSHEEGHPFHQERPILWSLQILQPLLVRDRLCNLFILFMLSPTVSLLHLFKALITLNGPACAALSLTNYMRWL